MSAPTAVDVRFYWLPFPGMYQAALIGADGAVIAEGMGTSKPDAEAAARRIAAEQCGEVSAAQGRAAEDEWRHAATA